MEAILGKKLGMTRVFDKDGKTQNVTIIECGPCTVTQAKNKSKDGYDAVQIGYSETKDKFLKKPIQGHLKKSGAKSRYLKEVKVISKVNNENDSNQESSLKIGDKITINMFKTGDKICISGISKGKGFAGTIKRWNFQSGPKSHGSHNIRQPGSIGASSYPSRVFPGKKMSGHMGAQKVTVKNLEIVDIDKERNLLLVRGSIPGFNNSIVFVKKV